MTGTAGIILINDMLPRDIQFPYNKQVDSKLFNEKMKLFAKKYPEKFSSTISHISNIGEKMSFYLGANVGPKDLKIDAKANKKLMSSIEKKMNKEKTIDGKRNVLLGGLKDAVGLASKVGLENEMAQQVKSGSRGKPVQFARMAVGPVYAVDMNQLPKPTLIKNNFTNGLNSQEYFNVSSQGRFSSVQAANATSEPGALGKVLVANADDQTITIDDCKTTNGNFANSADRHIIGRYEAGTNKLIDDAYFKIVSKKNKKIKVRSPLTCQAKKGLCAKCYGLMPTGRAPSVGDNVGIIAAQTIGEVLTQMTLSTKHSTMGKNKSDDLKGVEGFKAIANSPSSFSGSSVVATGAGVVTKIQKAPQGGHEVFVGSKRYFVPPTSTLKVKSGDMVSSGDPLSSGVVTPKQILETRGIGEAREHESSMLHKLFLDSTGKDLQKKHFEIVAKGHLSLGSNKQGEVESHSSLMENYPKMSMLQTVDKNIMGKYLAEDVGSLSKGLEIDDRVYKRLKKWMIHRVKTTKERPSVKPLFKSLDQRPTFGGNLFSKMNYRNLSKAIKEEILYKKKPSFTNTFSSDRAKHTAGVL